jgi:hypothetical protein
MPAFRSVMSVPLRFVGRSFSTNSRPALRAAFGRPPARRRHDGHRGIGLTHPAPGYPHLDGDPGAHSPWLLDTHRRVRREPAPLRLGRAPHDPRAPHRRHRPLLAPDPIQRCRAHRDRRPPTDPPTEITWRHPTHYEVTEDGPLLLGPRWVRTAAGTTGHQRAEAVTSGIQESQVTPGSTLRPHPAYEPGAGFKSPLRHPAEQDFCASPPSHISRYPGRLLAVC